MVIGAHPADAIDLAGGTIYQHSQFGDDIVVVSLTRGMYSHSSIEILHRGDGGALKERELKAAASILGAKEAFCRSYIDEPLVAMSHSTIILIAELIKDYKPSILITHHPNEYAHWDHAECGAVVCRALKTAIKYPSEDRYWVPMVYFFAVQFRPESARIGTIVQPPDVLIELSPDTIEKKIEALCCFESQGHCDSAKMRRRMDSFESEMGRADGLEYSEGFIFYYPLKRRRLMANPSIGFYHHTRGGWDSLRVKRESEGPLKSDPDAV
jgi:LmbE family N-acetylglucosaminyl deacetylase